MSRTDSIGDVVLTLPMAGIIKKQFPGAQIIFLGRSYTKDIIGLSEHVQEFVNYDEIEKLDEQQKLQFFKNLKADVIIHVFPKKPIAMLAKRAGIAMRVGTRNRLFHWLTCNHLVKLSRKNSPLHEAQLNLVLLSCLGINTRVGLNEIPSFYGFTKLPTLNESFQNWIDPTKFNLILHPRSKGSAKEWGLGNFEKLIQLLPKDKFKIFISGTGDDAKTMVSFLENAKGAVDITGKLSLEQFIAFICQCNGLVAASTGPLHIAAALNKTAIGLFSPKRPIHPGRWMPLGANATSLVFDPICTKCSEGSECNCIQNIQPERVAEILIKKGNERV